LLLRDFARPEHKSRHQNYAPDELHPAGGRRLPQRGRMCPARRGWWFPQALARKGHGSFATRPPVPGARVHLATAGPAPGLRVYEILNVGAKKALRQYYRFRIFEYKLRT
jgi:hypothetical protein